MCTFFQPSRLNVHVVHEPVQVSEVHVMEQLQDVPDQVPGHWAAGGSYGPVLLLHACKSPT